MEVTFTTPNQESQDQMTTPLRILLVTKLVALAACGTTKQDSPGEQPGRTPSASGGMQSQRVHEAQDVLRMPEVDTGGFLLYTPPPDLMESKCPFGIDAWTGTEWSEEWQHVGFAYCDRVVPANEPPYYVVTLWLADLDIKCEPIGPVEPGEPTKWIKHFKRIGSKGPGAGYMDGPVLYDLQLDTAGEKLTRVAFDKHVKDFYLGEPLPVKSNAKFQVWNVVESFVPSDPK
jgi:hypothetical protein